MFNLDFSCPPITLMECLRWETETDKKWVVQNCVEVFTLHRDNNTIEYCCNLSVSVSVSVNAP